MQTCKLSFDVTFDPTKTNPAKLAELLDFMLGQSLQTNVLDDQGRTEVGTVTVEGTTTLTLNGEDESELFYAFKNRGSSETQRKVAKFLRALDVEKGRSTPPEYWYAK